MYFMGELYTPFLTKTTKQYLNDGLIIKSKFLDLNFQIYPKAYIKAIQ